MLDNTPLPLQLANGASGYWYRANQFPTGLTANLPDKMFSNPATQAVSANQPNNTANAIGGKSALRFDGVNDALSAASTSKNSDIFAAGGTIAGVFKAVSAGGGSFGRIYDKIALLAVSGALSAPNSGQLRLTTLNGGTFDSAPDSIVYGQKYFFVLTYDSSSNANVPTLYLNSTSPVSVTTAVAPSYPAISDAAAALFIGNRSTGDRAFDGDIAELIAMKKILKDGQIAQLIHYLAAEWEIAIS